MKKQFAIPSAAVVGGIAAFFLRLLQNHTGFEPETGLPIPGNAAGLMLIVLLAALAAALLVLVRRLPKEGTPVFPQDLSTEDPRMLTLPVTGVFLIALSGALDLFVGLSALGAPDGSSMKAFAADAAFDASFTVVSTHFAPKAHVLLGVLFLLSAAGLFLCTADCRLGKRARKAGNGWLLVPVVALVFRLVLTYRIDSVNPALSAYYVELLALVFLTLGFYRLSSFAFQAGRTSLFAFYAGAAVVLSIASLADTDAGLSSMLLYAGGALVLLGFLLLRLAAPPVPAAAEDGE